ncbi:hypothetical protein PaG_00762 [Moesziomyces aphidis]|uniref:Haloacid dehalogenase n=1 Tax=Moesziomyces aphidis TaxID=84754 RepID=W3VVG0_MOEAP|nr:hypothetical protein PaG_00762 [Moesziomyces aphidis]
MTDSEAARAKLQDVEVMYFDVFGTVVDYVDTVTRALRREIDQTRMADEHLLRALQQDYDWRHFTIAWRSEYKRETQRLAALGNPDRVTVDQMHLAALGRLLSDLPFADRTCVPESIRKGGVEAASKHLEQAWTADTRARLNHTWHLLDPWKDSVQGLESLAETHKIGTLTNGNLNLMVDMAKHARLPWHFILSADLIGSFKPDPKMYTSAMALFDIDRSSNPARACMVAAHLYDLQAAKECGMTTVFVSCRPTEDSLPPEGKPSYVDIVVDDLLGLARLASPSPTK